jgi:hypothetical protein
MEDMNSGQTMLFGERKVRKRKKNSDTVFDNGFIYKNL